MTQLLGDLASIRRSAARETNHQRDGIKRVRDCLVMGGGWETGSEMNSGMSHSYSRVKITHVRTHVEFSVLIVVTFKGGKQLSVFFIVSLRCCIFFYTCVIVAVLIRAFFFTFLFFVYHPKG